MRGYVALALLAFATSVYADDVVPIRQFDLPTTEKLGRQIYDQDQEAWKASDILSAKHSKDELRASKAHGWIVESRAGRDVVRFIRDGFNGPEVSYDVTFAGSAEPVLSEPPDRTLNADELSQFNARMLALDETTERCSDTYNTVALRDLEQDRWIVWSMAATATDPDLIIIGGHYRFTISSDGRKVIEKDRLSNSCIQFKREKGPNGEPGQIFFTHRVTLTPIETHIFASLSYKMPFRIGTSDGKAWKVDQDKITNIDMDMRGIDGAAARQLAAFDESCFATIAKSGDAKAKNEIVPIKSVIEATENATKYVPDVPAGRKVILIACGRDDFALAPNDYKVLHAGIPFMIVDRGVRHPRNSGTVYVEGGRFRFAWEEDRSPRTNRSHASPPGWMPFRRSRGPKTEDRLQPTPAAGMQS